MNTKIERVRFISRYISAGTSLADNAVVKNHKLETLEKEIVELCSEFKLTDNQRLHSEKALKTISELKLLKGDSFRSRALVLGGQVELFINNIS